MFPASVNGDSAAKINCCLDSRWTMPPLNKWLCPQIYRTVNIPKNKTQESHYPQMIGMMTNLVALKFPELTMLKETESPVAP